MKNCKRVCQGIPTISSDSYLISNQGTKIGLPCREQELLESFTPEMAHAEALATPMDIEIGNQVASRQNVPERKRLS